MADQLGRRTAKYGAKRIIDVALLRLTSHGADSAGWRRAVHLADLGVGLFCHTVSRTNRPCRILAVAIGFSGAMLILRPWETGFTIWSVVQILAGSFYALAMIATRRYCADEPTLGLNLLFFAALGFAGAVGSGVLSVAPQPALAAEASFFFQGWVWPLSIEVWALLALQAIGSILAVLAVTKGYQSAETSLVIPFEYTFLISASVTAWALFGEGVDRMTLVGMVLIFGAGLFIVTGSANDA
jgi:drug/metabolite transporter (DMT)-like permease